MAKEAIYYACPFCGWHRGTKDGVVDFTKVDPSKVSVLSKRFLTGRVKNGPHGGIKIVSETKLKDVPAKLREQIRTQAQRVLDALET